MPKVSIITPCHNSGKFISDTINSVLLQTFSDWEMLITDDCSTDNSVEIIETFVEKGNRIKLIKSDKNLGGAGARNLAIRQAQGKFIAFLGSDDIWEKEKLERQIIFMGKNNYAFSFSQYYIMDEQGNKTEKIIQVPKSIDYKHYLSNTIIGCLTVVIDREKTGNFEMPLIKSSHDMALWLLIMRRGFQAFGMQEILAGYRIVSNSNTAKKWKAAKDVWKVYRKYEKLSLLYSAYCFIGYVFHAIRKRL
ncbi:MAG: glycosyltransferase family 2 protein [Bacteroidales bacterium]|nr:glycosyltransferase family 2 protein [Bacteroidales bacterium]